jgi:DNA-binding MarR family transcriptional regulator
MKQFEEQTIAAISAEDLAGLVMEIVPLVTRSLRSEMRRHRGPNLTIPQFRALGYMGRNPGCMLSDVAEHLGLTLPTTSKMIDRLQAEGLVSRAAVAGDRRKLALNLTEQGNATRQAAAAPTRARLAELMDQLPDSDRAVLVAAMHILSDKFSTTESP